VVVIDAQVHVWFADSPSRPWDPAYRQTYREKRSYLQHAGQANTPSMALEEMQEAGVDAALLTSLGIYGTDIDHELEAAEHAPGIFQVVGVVDHSARGVTERISNAVARGLRGVRLLELRDADRVARGEFEAVLQACSDLGLFVVLPMVYPLNSGLVDLFRRFPTVFFMFNHLATGFAPPIIGFRPDQPFGNLASILELAAIENVGLKLTGAPALSAEDYPYRDIWDPVTRIVRAFGADRVAWGSDYTRVAGLLSYWSGVHYLAEMPDLAAEEKELLYGETIMQRTRWRPDGTGW
jgi:L-fuconolactonase